MSYIVGIDGGGTKTAICAVDLQTWKYHSTTIGSADMRAAGAKKVASAIRQAVFDLIQDEPIACTAAGMPLYGESGLLDAQMQAELHGVFPNALFIANDVEVGMAGSLGLQPGVHVVAGTGSIAFGRDTLGGTARAGGWDEFYSDEGSCYWLGRKTMQLFSQQSDGRVPKGPLHGIIRKAFALQRDFDLIDYARNSIIASRSATAAMQIHLKEAALLGDASAVALYDRAAEELFRLIIAVKSSLSLPAERWAASYSGGLFKTGPLILGPLTRQVEGHGGQMVPPLFPPEHGALLLAAEHACLPDKMEALKRFLIRMTENRIVL